MSIARLTAEESVLMAPPRRELLGKKNMAVQLISAEKSMGEKIKPARAGFSHLESLQQNERGLNLSAGELDEVCTDLTVLYKETEDFVILRREV